MPYKNKEEGNINRKLFYKNNNGLMRERRLKYRKMKRDYIDNYKLSKGCAVCGYNKCASALDFHHDGNKEYNIANARNSMGLKRLIEEMDKCIVLCRNCHAELHENLRRNNRQE